MPINYTLTVPLNINLSPPQKALPVSLSVSSKAVTTSIPASSSRVPSNPPQIATVYSSLCQILSKFHFYFHSFWYPLQKVYFGLGEEKWRECIDGTHHDKGKYVFDRGLHGGTVEPGFIASMESAFRFASQSLNRKIDAAWYLQLHRRTCAHFNGDPNIYMMGQERVGVFRNRAVGANFRGTYKMTDEALKEFKALDAEIKRQFGDSYGLGEFSNRGPGWLFLNYKAMTEEQITVLFNKFLSDFYQEIERAGNDDKKLMAIARLHQRLEWLHPVTDGTARTSTVLMNKLLTEYNFHPAILEYPHVSSSYGLNQWFKYLKDGLKKWEQAKAAIK
jgi:hypothetical protein